MRAYNLAMVLICVNAGIYIIATMGIFGDMSEISSIFPQLNSYTEPIITVAGVEIKGIDLIAAALATATIIVLNTNAVNDRGIAYTIFTIVFWGSFGVSSIVISKFGYYNDQSEWVTFPGIEIFYTVFFLISVMIFLISLVQLPTGGQKTHV